MTTSTEKTRKPKAPASGKRAGRDVATGVFVASKKKKPAASPAQRAIGRAAERRIAEQRGEYGFMITSEKTAADSAREIDVVLTKPLPVQLRRRAPKHPPMTLFDRMGRLLDQPLRSESDVVRLVDAGLPAAAFTHLTRVLKIDQDLIAPESTIRRRVQDNKRFTTDESERMVRIARVHALASELFGDDAAAQAWLNAPRTYVPGAASIAPYKLAVTDAGARLVEEMLLRTAHGVF